MFLVLEWLGVGIMGFTGHDDFTKDPLVLRIWVQIKVVFSRKIRRLSFIGCSIGLVDSYKVELGKVSGAVLNDIRSRYDRGDTEVIDTLAEIAVLADKGKTALEKGDVGSLNKLINKNFDLRSKIMNISDSNIALVNTARSCGASAKFTGSGGSIIGLYKDNETLTKLIIEMKKLKARVIKPFIF